MKLVRKVLSAKLITGSLIDLKTRYDGNTVDSPGIISLTLYVKHTMQLDTK